MVVTLSCSLGPHKVVGPHRYVPHDSRLASALPRLFWEERQLPMLWAPSQRQDHREPQLKCTAIGGPRVQTAEGEEDPNRGSMGQALGSQSLGFRSFPLPSCFLAVQP